MNDRQRVFLEQIAQRIPRLFEAIRQGNVSSEYIIGVRQIGQRQVRLKLVAEVVDPGANPLASHGMQRQGDSTQGDSAKEGANRSDNLLADSEARPASRRRRPRKR